MLTQGPTAAAVGVYPSLQCDVYVQVRIEGMLMAQPPLLLCFQISQLLAFYQRTVSSMLGSRCQLADTLAATCKLARRVFAEQLKARGDKLLRYPPKPQQDLSPPPQVGDLSLGRLPCLLLPKSATRLLLADLSMCLECAGAVQLLVAGELHESYTPFL